MKVTEVPEQIGPAGIATILTDGTTDEVTVTVMVAVLVHPPAPVPVTVYVVVVPGVTVTDVPLKPPGFHEYVVAPLPVSTDDCPEQMAAGEALAVTVGTGFTVTVTVAVLVHPPAPVPITVYIVVIAGVTVTDVPLRPPGFHE